MARHNLIRRGYADGVRNLKRTVSSAVRNGTAGLPSAGTANQSESQRFLRTPALTEEETFVPKSGIMTEGVWRWGEADAL